MILLKVIGKKKLLINCDNVLYVEARPTYASLNNKKVEGEEIKCRAIVHLANGETLDIDDVDYEDVVDMIERMASDCGEVESGQS